MIDDSLPAVFEGLTSTFALGSVPISVPMADVYRNVEFPEAPARSPTS